MLNNQTTRHYITNTTSNGDTYAKPWHIIMRIYFLYNATKKGKTTNSSETKKGDVNNEKT